MRVRYQFLQYPQTSIYETPAQAYLILEGSSALYQTRRLDKRRRSDSLNCLHRCHRSKSVKNQPRDCVCRKEEEQRTRTRLESEHRCRQKSVHASKEYGNRVSTPTAFSFRDVNLPDPRPTISCNYDKFLQQQNSCLRKQNKFLQEYIQTLERKPKKDKDPMKRQRISREKPDNTKESRYESTRNSFMKRHVDSSQKNSEDEGSTFAQKTFSSKQSQYNLYRN